MLSVRDRSCRVTAHVEGTEDAHLIPKTESAWFDENRMSRYAKAARPDMHMIESPRNAIVLRSDIHGIFDQKRFVLLPKRSEPPVFVIHVLVNNSPDLVDLYHNVSLQPLYDVSIECLFARFAWSIFSYTAPFFAQGVDRVLSLVTAGASKTVELAGNQCRKMVLSPRSESRSTSPEEGKRDRWIAGIDDDDDDDGDDDDPPRGRKRRRSFEVFRV